MSDGFIAQFVNDEIKTNPGSAKALNKLISEAAASTATTIAALQTLVNTVNTTVNTVNSNLTSKSAIKSVQRGSTAIPASSLSVTVTISSVNINKSLVLLNGQSGYSYSTGSNSYAYTLLPRVLSLSSTSLVIACNSASYGTNREDVSWQVIEFV